MAGSGMDSSRLGTMLLCFFACLLLLVSHAAASTLSEMDGQPDLLIPHPRVVYYRLRSANPPLKDIAASFVSSIFPSSSVPSLALAYARIALTSVMASLFPSLGNLDIDLASSFPVHSFPATFAPQIAANDTNAPAALLSSLASSFLSSMLPAWLVPEVLGLRSLFPFLLMLGLVLYLHHDSSYKYMLHGSRPKLPLLPDLRVAPRLGHRVGSKRGRKLSAVTEEEDGSEEESEEEEVVDEMDSGMGLPAMCGMVRERGLDLMMRQRLSAQQSLKCIAE